MSGDYAAKRDRSWAIEDLPRVVEVAAYLEGLPLAADGGEVDILSKNGNHLVGTVWFDGEREAWVFDPERYGETR